MLSLPDDLTDALKLADWLELYATISPDGNSSQGDLERELRRAALRDLQNDELVEMKTLEVFREIQQRVLAAGQRYPYEVDYGTLRLKSQWHEYPVYTFCLCLSYFGAESPIRSLFEQVCCLAAKKYLDGQAIGFGHPRTNLPSAFDDAVGEICRLIGEGGCYRDQPPLSRKDDTLDVVAWREFRDGRPSKLLMFGQCASGSNWEEKIGEMNAEAFCKQWMQDSLVSPDPVRSFFVPHRIRSQHWDRIARRAGILFDRCRIAELALVIDQDLSAHTDWVRRLLESLRLDEH